jgi:hypothetical protein
MKNLLLSLVILLNLTACRSAPTPTPPADAQFMPHLLLGSQGKVFLKRDNWTGFVPIAFGTTLKSNDLLEVEREARVLCADLRLKVIKAGKSGVPCSSGQVVLNLTGTGFVSRRGTSTPRGSYISSVPYILYPRRTLILNDRPTLRWHDTGASSYAAEILLNGKPVWSKIGVTGNKLPYPADVPPLQPDQTYLVLVTDGDTAVSSRDEGVVGLGFQVAAGAEAEVIEAGRNRISAVEGLTQAERDFVLGVYYANLEEGKQPLGEGWLLLEEVFEKHQLNTPAVHLWRSDVLAGLDLPKEMVEAAYLSALDSAATMDDWESQATAAAGLWRLTGDADYYDRALALYVQLGDQAEVDALEQEKSP